MNKLTPLAVLSAAALLAACGAPKSPPEQMIARTVASVRLTSAAGGAPQPQPQSPVQGTLTFSELRDIVSVNGTITGLKPNAPHAFHVHENGNCSSPDFMSAGGHYNPGAKPHGAAGNAASHVGDLPQLMADASGTARVSFNSQALSLRGPDTIIGKAVIVHRDPDDFNAQPAGNSGPRLACGVIALQPAR